MKEANVYIVDSLGSITDITTDGSGTFKIIGLDDEIDYTLVEKLLLPDIIKLKMLSLSFPPVIIQMEINLILCLQR